MRALARCLGSGVALAILAGMGTTFAQNDELQRRAAAEALFEQGKKLEADGKIDAACPKFEEVVRLLPGKIGSMLTLARCYKAQEKLASAQILFEQTERLAAQAGDARAREAHDAALALKSRVPRLTITVPEATRAVHDIEVKRDGVRVGGPQWGEAIPVDPGKHTVSASAPGKMPWTKEIEVPVGEVRSVDVPALQDEASASGSPPPPAPSAPPPPAGAPARDSGAVQSAPVWPWVVGGTGVALLGVAAGFGIDGLSAQNDLASACPTTTTCPPSYDPKDDNARKNRGLTGFLALGGAGAVAVTAAIIGLASTPTKAPRAAITVAPTFSWRGAGAELEGAF